MFSHTKNVIKKLINLILPFWCIIQQGQQEKAVMTVNDEEKLQLQMIQLFSRVVLK